MTVFSGSARWWLIGLLSLLTLSTILPQLAPAGQPMAVNGLVDLRLAEHGQSVNPVTLDGEWLMFWGELLPPEAVSARPTRSAERVVLPRFFQGSPPDEDRLRTHGVATLALTIQVPDDYGPVAIRIPPIYSAYQLWVNGHPVASAGTVGTTRATTAPAHRGATAFAVPQHNRLELVLQIANFHEKRMGLVYSITMGPAALMTASQSTEQVTWVSISWIFALLGLQSMMVYRSNAQLHFRLWLGLVLVFNAVIIAMEYGLILDRLPPGWGWQFYWKLWYSLYLTIVPIGLRLFQALFPAEMAPVFVRWSWPVILPLAGIVLVTPANIFSLLHPVAHFLNIAVVIFAVSVGLRAISHRRPHAQSMTLGGTFMLLWMIQDWGRYYGMVQLEVWMGAALAILFAGAVALIDLQDYRKLSTTAGSLQTENLDLVNQLRGQLAELLAARRFLAEQDEQMLRKMSEFLHSRVQSKLLAASYYLGEVTDSKARDSDSSTHLLTKIEGIITDVRENDVRLVSHRLYPFTGVLGLRGEIASIVADYTAQYAVAVTIAEDLGVLEDAQIDPTLEPARQTCYRVIVEALANIQAHAQAKRIGVELTILSNHLIEMVIWDDGVGFDPATIEPGLGMRIMQARLAESGGSLVVQSQPGQGTRLVARLPVLPPDAVLIRPAV